MKVIMPPINEVFDTLADAVDYYCNYMTETDRRCAWRNGDQPIIYAANENSDRSWRFDDKGRLVSNNKK